MEDMGTESHSEILGGSQVLRQAVGTALGKGRNQTRLRKTGQ